MCAVCAAHVFIVTALLPAWQGVDCLLLLVDKCCFIVWHVIAPLGNIYKPCGGEEEVVGWGYCYKTATFAHSILPYSG